MQSSGFVDLRSRRLVTSCLCSLVALSAACAGQMPVQSTQVDEGGAPSESEIAGILNASGLPATVDSPLPDDPMAVTVHRLSNGMTVYISRNPIKPSFSAWIAVRTGGRNDPPNSTGLAHYLEHMLFKGTDELGTTDIAAEQPHLDKIAALYDQLSGTQDPAKRAEIFAEIDKETQLSAKPAIPNEFSALYSALGIDGLNAFTNDDATVYIADVPANRFDAWARTEAERFADPRFRLFYPELEAVYEEKNRALDSPFRRSFELARAALFPAHPYGTQTVIGTPEHLKNPAYGDMVAYFHRWYVPNNMAIILAGDVDPKTAIPVLEATLGQLKPKSLEAPAPAALTGPKGRVVQEFEAEGQESVDISWRTAAQRDKDEPALTVMDWVVDNSTSGLLNLEITLPQRLPAASSSSTFLHEGGYWTIRGTARQGQSLEEVEALLMGVVAKLKAGEFSDEVVQAIALHERVNRLARLEDNDGRVSLMMEAFIQRMDWPQMIARDQAVQKIGKADVVAAANRYLGDDFVVVRRRAGKPSLPKIDKPKITPIEMDAKERSPFYDQVISMPVKSLEPSWIESGKDFQKIGLPSADLIYVRNTQNPLFSVSIEIERGMVDDRLLCTAVDVLRVSGSETKSAADLRQDIYALGSSINIGCSAETVFIRAAGLDQSFEPTMAILVDWFRNAKLDPQELEKYATNTVSRRRDQLADPSFRGFALAEFARYGKDSSFLQQPSNAALKKARAPDLQKRVRGLLDVRHSVEYYGPRSQDQVTAMLTLGDGTGKPGVRKPKRFRSLKKTTVYALDAKVAKASVDFTIPLGDLPDTDRAKSAFITEYFGGGMAGAVFQEIREARGLAYSAWGWLTEGRAPQDDWAYLGGVQTQVDKTIDALDAYFALLATPLVPERIALAKDTHEQAERSRRYSTREIASYASSWRRRGYLEDPRKPVWNGMRAIEAADLAPWLAAFSSTPIIISVAADFDKLDPAALSKFGEVVKVRPEQLTSW